MLSVCVAYETICIDNRRTVIVDNTSNYIKDVVIYEEYLKQAEDGIIYKNKSEFEDESLLRSFCF